MRNAIFHIILILLLPFFITSCTKTKTETQGNIEGKIIDNTNAQPIPAAEVKISGSNQIIFSGTDGAYQFINLEAGEYQITVSKQNYVQETKPISVMAGRTANLDFALSPFGLTIKPANQNVGDTAGTTQFTITSNISWTAAIDQPWCSIDKTSGNGNNIITATYQPNTTFWERKATLTITGNNLAPEHVTLTQSGPPYVSICNQVWMVKNLDVATYRNGDPIPQVADAAAWAGLTTGAYCYYNNDSATYAANYGKLYNWYAVDDPRGLAPAGWHVASDAEWTELTNCLGGEALAGGKMKQLGFAQNPGGERYTEGGTFFIGIGIDALWWSSTGVADPSTPPTHAFYRLLQPGDDLVRSETYRQKGFSVLCIRD